MHAHMCTAPATCTTHAILNTLMNSSICTPGPGVAMPSSFPKNALCVPSASNVSRNRIPGYLVDENKCFCNHQDTDR